MTIYTRVDPSQFINTATGAAFYGRGAWTRTGIGFDYRYALNPTGYPRIGTSAETDLSSWAVAAGCHGVQRRLISLGFLTDLPADEVGVFGPQTRDAVVAFQAQNSDPQTGVKLVTDGTVGRSDARSLFTPVIDQFERESSIPGHLLRGEVMHESALDPGAVGYYIFYGDANEYRGVDRGMCQINSKSNPGVTWEQAYYPGYAIRWSAKRLRSFHDDFVAAFPGRDAGVYWDAAVCAHNNPSAARAWAKAGGPTTEDALSYVSSVKAAIY